jgi:ATP-dependent Lon protease
MARHNGDKDLDDLTLDLPVIPTGQDVVFPGQVCEIAIRVHKNFESKAFIGLLKKIVKERSSVVFTVQIGRQQNQPEFSELVTFGMITELKFAADQLKLKVAAIGRATVVKPYQPYFDGDRRYESVFSVGVMPIFEPIVTNSEWSGIEYALVRGSITRDIEEWLGVARLCVDKMRELGNIDKSNEQQFKELLAALIQAPQVLARAVSADDFEDFIKYLLGQMSFERQLKYLAQNSLRDRLNSFHEDVLELIEECEAYLFEYEGDNETKEPNKSQPKSLPARSGETPTKGSPNALFVELRRQALDLSQKIDMLIANLK